MVVVVALPVVALPVVALLVAARVVVLDSRDTHWRTDSVCITRR